MFAYLKGILAASSPHHIVLEVGGIGYEIFISIACFENLPKIGTEIKIFTSLIIREDSHKIFGFLSLQEKELFQKLCDISGIGPRLSLSILGHMSFDDLSLAVEQKNTKAVSKIPGIGKKMAERLILELGDTLQKMGCITSTSNESKGILSDAIATLINLGYNPLDAQKSVQAITTKHGQNLSLSELISLALKKEKC